MTRADGSAVLDYTRGLRVDGRTFVVLGAGHGMGRQVAHGLVQNGGHVVAVDLDRQRAEDVADEIGAGARPWSGDLTDRTVMEQLFADVAAANDGRLDGLLDTVGMSEYEELERVDDRLWDWHFDICLRQAWLAVQCATPLLRAAGGGSMTFVTSATAMTSAPLHAAYGAAKAGLGSLLRTAAVELGGDGIRVNGVAPGVVWTPRSQHYLGEDGRQRLGTAAPIGRITMPTDVASAMLFLASDLGAGISGETIVVDGGVSAKFPYAITDLYPRA